MKTIRTELVVKNDVFTIKATAYLGKSLVFPYDKDVLEEINHTRAARVLADSLSIYAELVGGRTSRDAYTWVSTHSQAVAKASPF